MSLRAASSSDAQVRERSFLASDLTIRGSISTKGVVEIDGALEGDVSGGTVLVGRNGRLRATIDADNATVSGTMAGLIKARSVTFADHCDFTGEVQYERLRVEPAAHVDGTLHPVVGADARSFVDSSAATLPVVGRNPALAEGKASGKRRTGIPMFVALLIVASAAAAGVVYLAPAAQKWRAEIIEALRPAAPERQVEPAAEAPAVQIEEPAASEEEGTAVPVEAATEETEPAAPAPASPMEETAPAPKAVAKPVATPKPAETAPAAEPVAAEAAPAPASAPNADQTEAAPVAEPAAGDQVPSRASAPKATPEPVKPAPTNAAPTESAAPKAAAPEPTPAKSDAAPSAPSEATPVAPPDSAAEPDKPEPEAVAPKASEPSPAEAAPVAKPAVPTAPAVPDAADEVESDAAQPPAEAPPPKAEKTDVQPEDAKGAAAPPAPAEVNRPAAGDGCQWVLQCTTEDGANKCVSVRQCSNRN